MVFLHKLAQRLARLKTALIVGVVVAIACEIPLPVDPSGTIAMLLVSPKTLTTRAGQMADFVVVGLTTSGDTASVPVTWSVTGGTMVDTSSNGGKHFGKYKAPMSPGRYKVVAQSGGVADSAVVDVSAVPVATVSVSPASASATVGQTVQLTATTRDSTGATLSGRIVTWASNNAAAATVSASGLVTGVAAGAATITATSEGKSGSATVTFTPPPVASVIVSPAAVSAAVGQAAQFTVRLEDASGNALTGRVVSWTSSNTGVATVNGSGLVATVATGLAIITATSEGKNGTAGITVTLTPATVASVSVTPASANVIAGQTLQLTATVRDASGNVLQGRVVTWASDDASLATVSGSGVVTGVDAGTATITATSEGQSGSAAVTVTVPVATLGVSPASASVISGQTVQLTATPRDANGNVLTGRVVTWASSNTGRATVNGTGLVTGGSTGTVTITATSEGKSGTAALTITPVPVATVTVSPATPSVAVGQMVQLTATTRDGNGNVLTGRVITWSSNALGTATVSGSGLVTGVAAGPATITATSEGQSGSSTVTVTPPAPVATVSLNPATPSVAAGQTVQLTATLRDALGNPLTGRVITWASNATGTATVSGSGLVTGVAAGLATITATSEGKNGTAAVTVTTPPPPGTWQNEPAGWRTITDYPFNDAIPLSNDASIASGWHIAINAAGRVARVSDATAPTSPSNVVRINYPAGFGAGSEPGTLYYPHSGTKDHYVGYDFKLSNPYSNQTVGTKQWYPYSSTGNYFMLFSNSGKMWLYVQADGSHGGAYNLSGNVSDPTITLGVWHRLEILQRYPSSSSANDGIFRWWIDGVLCGNHTNIGWNTSSTYDELRFAPTWGGIGGSVAFDTYWQIDHVHISQP